jgi:hypothetical protein
VSDAMKPCLSDEVLGQIPHRLDPAVIAPDIRIVCIRSEPVIDQVGAP